MNKKVKNILGLAVFLFLAAFSINSASAYKGIYDGTRRFKCDKNLTSVIVTDGVTKIGKHAFSGCTNLESITIPNSVKLIGSIAFHGCKNLTSITLSNNLTSI